MARLRSFTLDGEAIRVYASLNYDGNPVYMVELVNAIQNERLNIEGLLRFAQALQNDVSEWYGILHRYPEDTFTCGEITGFEKDWGGALDGVPLHPAPEE